MRRARREGGEEEEGGFGKDEVDGEEGGREVYLNVFISGPIVEVN